MNEIPRQRSTAVTSASSLSEFDRLFVRSVGQSRLRAALEVAIVFALFAIIAGSTPPDVNEAHYLAKAKHYWNPAWCAGDFFLESADAHLVFYWSFGWLTKFFSLATAAWIGRAMTWLLLAWSWQWMSRGILPRNGYAILSAGAFAVLMRWGHMAGEWVIGGVEAKGFAYGLLFFAVGCLVRGRWGLAIVLSGAGAAFHVLVGGWAVVALGWTWLWTRSDVRPSLRSLVIPLIVGGLLSLPGLWPALTLTRSVDPETLREANHIYVFERLAHHLAFHELRRVFIIRHAVLMVAFLILWRTTERNQRYVAFSGPLPKFVMGAMAIAVLGAVVDQALLYFPDLSAKLLRYYWFRMSDVMTPLGVAFGVLIWIEQLAAWRRLAGGVALTSVIAIVAADVGSILWERRLDPRPGSEIQAFPGSLTAPSARVSRWQEWMAVCDWIRTNTPDDAIFLSPRSQQTFKWYAHRAEVVNGKDVPQDARGVVGWRQRMRAVFPYNDRYGDLTVHGASGLRKLAEEYGFRYVIVDRRVSLGSIPFPRIYPDSGLRSNFEIYELPQPAN